MRKKLFTNIVAITSVVAMTFSLCSCGSKENASNPAGDETSDTTTLEAESSTDGQEESTSEKANTEEPTTEKPVSEEPTIITRVIEVEEGNMVGSSEDGFCLMSDIVKECTYTSERGETYKPHYELLWESLTCQYPLDGEDEDIIKIRCDDNEAYIEINGDKDGAKEIDFYGIHSLTGMAIVDINETDSYKEIAVLDDGPSGDPGVILFRYIDGEICRLGRFAGDYGRELFVDRNGKIVQEHASIFFVKSLVISEYAEIIGNKAVYTEVDYSDALNKEYTITLDVTGHFAETDDQTLDYKKINYDSNHEHTELSAGDKIKIIKADIEEEIYYVELSDGRRGLFATRSCAG